MVNLPIPEDRFPPTTVLVYLDVCMEKIVVVENANA